MDIIEFMTEVNLESGLALVLISFGIVLLTMASFVLVNMYKSDIESRKKMKKIEAEEDQILKAIYRSK